MCVVVNSIILMFIGVVCVVGLVLFDFDGKLDGIVVCVFVFNVLMIDFVFIFGCVIDFDEINKVMCVVVDGKFKGVFEVMDVLFVFFDFNYNLVFLLFDVI